LLDSCDRGLGEPIDIRRKALRGDEPAPTHMYLGKFAPLNQLVESGPADAAEPLLPAPLVSTPAD
jgi:hypothetical protein